MHRGMKRLLALALCAGLAAPGCASTQGPRLATSYQVASAPPIQRAVLVDFARSLPPGTRVRATTAGRRTVKGTLLKASDTAIFIQPRTRVVEPPVEIPLTELLALEQDIPSNTGRVIAIGAAVGAGAALSVILLLLAIYSD
jgi:hypothetical protein